MLVIGVAAIPILAGVGYFLNQQQQALTELARSNARQYVELAARHEEWLLGSAEELLTALAEVPLIRRQDWAECDRFLASVLDRLEGRYRNFGVIDRHGTVLCNALPAPEGGMPSLADRAYFQRALQSTGTVLGEYQVGRIMGGPTLAVAVALRDPDGAPTAVLYATFDLAALAVANRQVGSDAASELIVTDRHGVVLSQEPVARLDLGQTLPESLLRERVLQPGQSQWELPDIDGLQWVVASRSVGLPSDPDAIHVIYRLPLTAMLTPIRNEVFKAGAAMLVLLLLALAAGWAGTHATVGRNIRLLTDAARRLRQRQFTQPIRGHVSGQEFQEIAAQFDQMARELESYEAQWQATVQQQREQATILERIAQHGVLDDTLAAVVAMVESQGDFRVSLLRVRTDGTVGQVLAPHMPPAWTRLRLQDDAGAGTGSCPTCVREGRWVVCDDVQSDPHWSAIRSLALSWGVRACWSVPILASDGRVLGALSLLFAQPRPVSSPVLLQLAQTAADLAALAIDRDEIRTALTQSEAEYRELFEASPNPMWVTAADSGEILAVNDQALAQYGYVRSAFLALRESQLVFDAAADGGRAEADLPEVTGPRLQRHRRQDGSDFLVALTTSTIDFRGREARLVQVQDVTEHTLLRQGIRERDELFTMLMESTVEALYGVDAQGRCTFANRAFQALLGYGEDDIIGQDLHQLIHARYEDGRPHPAVDCPIRQAIRNGKALHRDDDVFWHKAGAPLPVEYWVYPLIRLGQPAGAIVTFLDITERRRQRDVLQHRASHDALTGLLNRAGFSQTVTDTVAGMAPGQRLGIFLLDLDGFKEVNDTLGHQLGDELLVQLAQRLHLDDAGQLAVARVGGDEFAVLWRLAADDGRESTAHQVLVQRARQMLRQIRKPVRLGELELQVSGSVGIACYPDHGQTLSELLRQADIAMYEAKRGGLGHAFSNPANAQHDPARLLLMTQLRQAIERGDMVLHFQPKKALDDARLVGYEALVRWPHPDRGLLAPGQFMPVLELSDLIHPFTDWALDAAVRQSAVWSDRGEVAAVAVNISARNLLDAALPDKVVAALRQHGVAPAQLELEITESSIMADPARSLDVLTRLHQIGVRIAIDDFGTGYSSLAYLQRLPVDNLKIDRSFVHDMPKRDEARKIVSAIISLAHGLDIQVTAEGIEDQATWLALRELGCDYGQGYYLGRPGPPAG